MTTVILKAFSLKNIFLGKLFIFDEALTLFLMQFLHIQTNVLFVVTNNYDLLTCKNNISLQRVHSEKATSLLCPTSNKLTKLLVSERCSSARGVISETVKVTVVRILRHLRHISLISNNISLNVFKTHKSKIVFILTKSHIIKSDDKASTNGK